MASANTRTGGVGEADEGQIHQAARAGDTELVWSGADHRPAVRGESSTLSPMKPS